ncbi:membrane protein insertion efficiency factor YidD [Patescibacteria group bacterium]|nr:membrane protein insertion efficiency factor YidD [Patescibacteria group bacterium]
MIRIYQKTFSFDHGPMKKMFPYGYCKYKPTCSSYCYESIKDDGLVVGSVKCIYRVLRCNPWSEGGYDPVHKKHNHDSANTNDVTDKINLK